jgi:ketosteroid isomerase-like protein
VSEAHEQNKALVRRLYDAHTRGGPCAMKELLAPDFDNHWLAPGQEVPGREGYIRSNAVVHALLRRPRPQER